MDDFKNNADVQKIMNFNKLPLGNWPTPLETCNAFENLKIKRGDLSGFGRGGIKTRKLETFLGYFLSKKIESLILIIPNISNLRADIEEISKQHRLDINFIVANDPPLATRSFLDKPGIHYTLAGKSGLSVSWHMLRNYFRLHFIHRKKAVMIFPGASHPASVLGASNALLEVYQQYQDKNTALPKHIFISASSGSSAAGLILGALILEQSGLPPVQFHIVQVFPMPMRFWINLMLYWTKRKFKLKVPIQPSRFTIIKSKTAYGAFDESLEKTCNELYDKYKLKVDHIYGARTWQAMKKFYETEYDGGDILFWHCGFTPDSSIFKQNT